MIDSLPVAISKATVPLFAASKDAILEAEH